MNLPPLTQRFVLHFGEMGSRWGINRTVGQIYALLFVSPKPLNADELGEAWGVGTAERDNGIVMLIKPFGEGRRQVTIRTGRGFFRAQD